jgi:hypothetical protein
MLPGAASTSVVCGAKALERARRPSPPNTPLIAAITAGALRRVWSQARTLPSRPSRTKRVAAAKTRGSAPRKR